MNALLSRVAEDLYWAARYLERAEDTARIVREYSHLIVDLPTSVLSAWEPLLAVMGIEPDGSDDRDEAAVIEMLVASADNASSIVECVRRARDNLRSCREVIPTDAWFVVNELHLYVTANYRDGLARRSRTRFLDRVIAEHQRLVGILAGSMNRDDAYSMMRLGRHVERADMTTRVLDVRAGALMTARPGQDRSYDDIQWTSVLRSLSALQMFHRSQRQAVSGAATVAFALHETAFPRSVAYCLRAAREGIGSLPNSDRVVDACEAAIEALRAFDPHAASVEALHRMADALQEHIGELHGALTMTYFRASVGPS